MNPSRPWFVLVARITLLVLFTLVVTACPADKPKPIQTPNIQTPPPQGDGGDVDIVGSAPSPAMDDYQVILEADKKMIMGSSNYLRVWIGAEGHMPPPVEEIVRDTTTVYADSNSYALVTPIAPDFKVEPDVAKRIPLKATGSSAVFSLYPLKRGKSYVTATVVIYDSEGNEDPQSTKRLSVRVSSDYGNKLVNIFMDYFLNFYTALVVLVLGALLFVIRRYIKKKTGYDEKKNKENL